MATPLPFHVSPEAADHIRSIMPTQRPGQELALVSRLDAHTHMKTTMTLLACLLAFALAAAQPPKPVTFEVRLVLASASADSEPLICTHPSGVPGHNVDEQLHVQKKPLLDRSALKSAAVQRNAMTGALEIAFAFTERGAQRFAQVTRDHIGQRLAIVIDGKVYSAPKVMMEIPGGKAVISGSFADEEAVKLAARLNGGATK